MRLLASSIVVCVVGAPIVSALAASPEVRTIVDGVFAETAAMLRTVFATGDSVAGTVLDTLLVPGDAAGGDPGIPPAQFRARGLRLPRLFVVGGLGGAAGGHCRFRRRGRWRGRGGSPSFRLEAWWLWPLIGSLALVLAVALLADTAAAPSWLPIASYAAWNAALVMLFLFGLQGLAILRFLLEKRGIARFALAARGGRRGGRPRHPPAEPRRGGGAAPLRGVGELGAVPAKRAGPGVDARSRKESWNMKVILNQDVVGLGEEGDIREVATGYARNFLLPKSLVLPHTKANLAAFERRRGAIERRREEKRTEALGLKERLEAEELKFAMPAGENGKLFGSVNNATLAAELEKRGYQIEKKRIEVPEHAIRATGTFKVRVRLYDKEEAVLKVVVEAAATAS